MTILEVGMPKKPVEAIKEQFSQVCDPRIDRTKEHDLLISLRFVR
jgi:hypothetical protein